MALYKRIRTCGKHWHFSCRMILNESADWSRGEINVRPDMIKHFWTPDIIIHDLIRYCWRINQELLEDHRLIISSVTALVSASMIFSYPTEGLSLLILPRFARAGGSIIHDIFWSYRRIIIADPTKIYQGSSLAMSPLLEVLSSMIFSDPTEGSSLMILPSFTRDPHW